MKTLSRRAWIRALLQPAIYLGMATLLFIGGGLAFLVERDRASAELDARRHVQNLAHVFEQSVSRALLGADKTLLLLRKPHQRDASLGALAEAIDLRNSLTFQYSVIGVDGRIVQSTAGGRSLGIDLSDRRHFREQRDAADDRLIISEPLVQRTTGQHALFLTRRMTGADGSFEGVLSASFDIMQLARSVQKLELGANGLVALIGADGIIRARIVDGRMDWLQIGRHVPTAGALVASRENGQGIGWGSLGPEIDPHRRLVAYRALDGLPLVAMVGVSELEVFAHAQAHARNYMAIAGILSLAIIVAMGFGVARERRLMATTAHLERRNLEFDAALDNMPQGLAMHDASGALRVCNDAYVAMYRLEPHEARAGASFAAMIDSHINGGKLPPEARDFIRRRITDRRAHRSDLMLPDGRIMLVTHQPMADGGWVAVHEDVTLHRRAEAEIVHLAHYDALTDLENRVLFRRRVEEALARLDTSGVKFNILYLDLDQFKAVNDSLGHAAGDRLVKQLALRLKAAVGPGDVVARLGGDEFGILQEVAQRQEDEAVVLAERLLVEVGRPFDLDGRQASVETSIGIVLAPRDGVEPEQLLRNADLALYKAKAQGRNAYRFFEPHLSAEARQRFDLEIDLRNAIAANAFELHYQPLVDSFSRRVCGAEALVRWPHGERGTVMPDAFIPLAESTGLIVPLGDWILRQACRQAASWPDQIKLAVNLSVVQFRKGDIVATVSAALAESGLAARRLELEITESVLLERDEANFAALHALKKLGASIVLDDFGTGYSSLSYLRSFPFDKIKIDRSFVADMPTHSDAATIVAAVAGLARNLDITITAEGVETAEQFALLRAVGCHQVQGYYFGRPGPPAALDFGIEHAPPGFAVASR